MTFPEEWALVLETGRAGPDCWWVLPAVRGRRLATADGFTLRMTGPLERMLVRAELLSTVDTKVAVTYDSEFDK